MRILIVGRKMRSVGSLKALVQCNVLKNCSILTELSAQYLFSLVFLNLQNVKAAGPGLAVFNGIKRDKSS